MENYFPTGVSVVAANDSTISIHISGNKYNPENFWYFNLIISGLEDGAQVFSSHLKRLSFVDLRESKFIIMKMEMFN